jgi:hypothetical protein
MLVRSNKKCNCYAIDAEYNIMTTRGKILTAIAMMAARMVIRSISKRKNKKRI